jgi:hypothetical protein
MTINNMLINVRMLLGILKLITVVGLYVLIIPLLALKWLWDQSLVVYCGDPAYHCMRSMQVVDITPMKHRLTSITSLGVVQQKHRRSKT